MSNKKFLSGVLMIALAFGMIVMGCDDGSTSGDTTNLAGTSWEYYNSNHGATETLTFSSTGNTVTLKDPWINLNGTYSVSGNNLTINFTSPAAKYTGVIGETKLTITTNEGETQVFNRK